MTFITIFILAGITLIDPIAANGQSKGRIVLSQESGRDPFLLPSGVRLLSKIDTASGNKGNSFKNRRQTQRYSSFSFEGQGHFNQ